jgi:hypothetical protein
MYSAGMFGSTPGLREALTGGEPPREWLDASRDRRRRMHSADTEALQAQLDRTRLYVAALFQLLVARGVFTVEEAQRLVRELEAAGAEPAGRDVVTGAEVPPAEDPFGAMSEAHAPRKRGWRARVKPWVVVAGAFALTAYAVGLAWLAAWVGRR